MGRRRRRLASSSLDLFLDTICNAFGSIVLISLLVTLVAQQKKRDREWEELPPVESTEFDSRSQEIETLMRKLQVAQSLAKTLKNQQPTPQELEAVPMQKRVIEAQRSLDEVIEKQVADSRKLAELWSNIAHQQREAEQLQKNLTKMQSAMLAKNLTYAELLQSASAKAPIPKEKETQKANFLMAMRYEKVYLVSDLASSDARDLDERFVQDSGGIIRPIPSAGWQIGISQDLGEFQRAIQLRPPSQYFISIGLWPDSYAGFMKLRETIVSMGYQYELILVDDVEGIPLLEGSHPKIQ